MNPRDVWHHALELPPRTYVCGHCNLHVASNLGYSREGASPAAIHLCPNCAKPTYFNFQEKSQMPGVAFGADVPNLPTHVAGLYREARNCMQVSAYTAATLAARKLLMNVAASQGAAAGESFQFYVNYLQTNGFVPPNARGWVDHIRKKGNEATHEIPGIQRSDAEELLTFIEMILKLTFDYPARIPTA